MRIGITGHSNLTADSMDLVRQALTDALTPYADGELVGVSCLARGADQLFAEVVLALGGQLEVVLPSADYRENKVKPDNLEQFDRLLVRSTRVRYMSHLTAGRQAYEDANEAVIGSVDRLFAVWDGQPATGKGGTADAVAAAGLGAFRLMSSGQKEHEEGNCFWGFGSVPIVMETVQRRKSRP